MQEEAMSRHGGLLSWTAMVSTQMPHLSQPQARVLAWWSYGIVMTRSCGRRTVATFLALLLGRKVTTCFVLLLCWMVSLWTGTQLALALDATALGERFVVLAVWVVYRGCAIPVAWTIRPANQPGAWRHEWLRLVRRLSPALPSAWTVLGLTDRGL
jgi:hypothetical protein